MQEEDKRCFKQKRRSIVIFSRIIVLIKPSPLYLAVSTTTHSVWYSADEGLDELKFFRQRVKLTRPLLISKVTFQFHSQKLVLQLLPILPCQEYFWNDKQARYSKHISFPSAGGFILNRVDICDASVYINLVQLYTKHFMTDTFSDRLTVYVCLTSFSVKIPKGTKIIYHFFCFSFFIISPLRVDLTYILSRTRSPRPSQGIISAKDASYLPRA